MQILINTYLKMNVINDFKNGILAIPYESDGENSKPCTLFVGSVLKDLSEKIGKSGYKLRYSDKYNLDFMPDGTDKKIKTDCFSYIVDREKDCHDMKKMKVKRTVIGWLIRDDRKDYDNVYKFLEEYEKPTKTRSTKKDESNLLAGLDAKTIKQLLAVINVGK